MDVDLKKYCGLEIRLDIPTQRLAFGRDINFSQPGVRSLGEMKEVLLDKIIEVPQELYYMYRDVYYFSDKPLLNKHRLRYDVTLIRPDYLGKELMKTAGHYHPGDFGELYEVVYGQCYCLLQRANLRDYQLIEEVILAEARAGEKIVIPPGFGHILVNPGPDYLVASNWVSSNFSSEYELYKKAQGAAYFITKTKEGGLEYTPNSYFKKLAKINFVRPSGHIDRFGLAENSPIYPLIKKDAAKLDFLNRPLDFDYQDIFAPFLKR